MRYCNDVFYVASDSGLWTGVRRWDPPPRVRTRRPWATVESKHVAAAVPDDDSMAEAAEREQTRINSEWLSLHWTFVAPREYEAQYVSSLTFAQRQELQRLHDLGFRGGEHNVRTYKCKSRRMFVFSV